MLSDGGGANAEVATDIDRANPVLDHSGEYESAARLANCAHAPVTADAMV